MNLNFIRMLFASYRIKQVGDKFCAQRCDMDFGWIDIPTDASHDDHNCTKECYVYTLDEARALRDRYIENCKVREANTKARFYYN